MAESRRLDDLRRRVREDPASLVFAQLAEECRRLGLLHEAIAVCRAGLRLHPGYVSARVTLGRALAAVGRLDEAGRELATACQAAPENLAALRTLVDVQRKRGRLADALRIARIALDLSAGNFELEQLVRDLAAELASIGRISSPGDSSGQPAAAAQASPPRDRHVRARRTIARLERWLAVLHGTRTFSRA